jgi:hypothetical protein
MPAFVSDPIDRAYCDDLVFRVRFYRHGRHDMREALQKLAMKAAADKPAKEQRERAESLGLLLPPDREIGRADRDAMTRFWYSLHGAVVAAANISKMLWPSETGRGGAQKMVRGERLRALLGLSAEDHLLAKRSLRDHLEHFDERLDLWASEAAAGGRLDCWITAGIPPFGGAAPWLRAYDRLNDVFWFRTD